MSDKGTLGINTEAVRVSPGGNPQGTGGVSRSAGGEEAIKVGAGGSADTAQVLDKDGKPIVDPNAAAPKLGADGKPLPAEAAAPALDKDGKPVPAAKVYTAEETAAIADPKLGKFTKSFIDNGDLTPAEITEAATAVGVPEAMVKGYLDGQKAIRDAGKPSPEAEALQAHAQANSAIAFEFSKDFKGWQDFAAWSQQGMTDAERSTVEKAVMNAHADPAAARIIIGNFYGKFQAAAGAAPRNVLDQGQHAPGAHVNEGFKSQAEMVTAMQDPRYNKDPAYTKEVTDKVAVSNWN